MAALTPAAATTQEHKSHKEHKEHKSHKEHKHKHRSKSRGEDEGGRAAAPSKRTPSPDAAAAPGKSTPDQQPAGAAKAEVSCFSLWCR